MSTLVAVVSAHPEGYRISVPGDAVRDFQNGLTVAESLVHQIIANRESKKLIESVRELLDMHTTGVTMDWEKSFKGLVSDLRELLPARPQEF